MAYAVRAHSAMLVDRTKMTIFGKVYKSNNWRLNMLVNQVVCGAYE